MLVLLYLDMSVFGGVFDEECADDSRRLINYIFDYKVRILMSEFVFAGKGQINLAMGAFFC